jgi:membrane protein implicated in regulation of membrane protease activity
MIFYLAVAGLGLVLLLLSIIFGELFDFLDVDVGDGEGGPISGTVIAAGMAAFGSAGALATYYGWGVLLSAGTAIAAAIAFGALSAWVLATLYHQTGGTDSSLGVLQGRLGQVTTSIPASGPGEVMVTGVDTTVHRIARSAGGQAIRVGSIVRIVDVIGSTLVVEPTRGDADAATERMETS